MSGKTWRSLSANGTISLGPSAEEAWSMGTKAKESMPRSKLGRCLITGSVRVERSPRQVRWISLRSRVMPSKKPAGLTNISSRLWRLSASFGSLAKAAATVLSTRTEPSEWHIIRTGPSDSFCTTSSICWSTVACFCSEESLRSERQKLILSP